LILLVGQLLTVIKAKHILLGAIFFFELGSLICAVAQSMSVLIFGRAIQGVGKLVCSPP
jgi:predicted MFS family arabinose efflux permease